MKHLEMSDACSIIKWKPKLYERFVSILPDSGKSTAANLMRAAVGTHLIRTPRLSVLVSGGVGAQHQDGLLQTTDCNMAIVREAQFESGQMCNSKIFVELTGL